MLLTITLVMAAWLLLSIISGVAVGTSIKRLDAPLPRPPRRPEGWRVVSPSANSGAPVLMLARMAPSTARRR